MVETHRISSVRIHIERANSPFLIGVCPFNHHTLDCVDTEVTPLTEASDTYTAEAELGHSTGETVSK